MFSTFRLILFQRSEYYDVVALGGEAVEDFLDSGLVLLGEVAFFKSVLRNFGKGLRVKDSVPVAAGEGYVVGFFGQVVVVECGF